MSEVAGMSGGVRKLKCAIDVSLWITLGSAGLRGTAKQMSALSVVRFLKLFPGSLELNFVEVSGMVQRVCSLVSREMRKESKWLFFLAWLLLLSCLVLSCLVFFLFS